MADRQQHRERRHTDVEAAAPSLLGAVADYDALAAENVLLVAMLRRCGEVLNEIAIEAREMGARDCVVETLLGDMEIVMWQPKRSTAT